MAESTRDDEDDVSDLPPNPNYLYDQVLTVTKHSFQIHGELFQNIPTQVESSIKENLAEMFTKHQDTGTRNSPVQNSNNCQDSSEINEYSEESVSHSNDSINSAIATPVSLLVQALVMIYCSLVRNKDVAKNLFSSICEELHSLNLIDDSYTEQEFKNIRSQYIVFATKGFEMPRDLQESLKRVTSDRKGYHKDFEKQEFIAGGSFGKVYKAEHRSDRKVYAIKKILITSTNLELIMQTLSEAKILASLNHPNIVIYKNSWLELEEEEGSIEDSETEQARSWASLYIQMSFCQQTLSEWLTKSESERFNDLTYPIDWTLINVLINMFTQLVKGVHHAHSRGIIHHDIKPGNVFVSKNEGRYIVQLGDFGLACWLNELHYGRGTTLYAAPEQLEGQCDPKNDMYSLGLVLLEIVLPLSTIMQRQEVLTDLKNYKIPSSLPANYQEIAYIISKLVQLKPENRLDTVALLKEMEKFTK